VQGCRYYYARHNKRDTRASKVAAIWNFLHFVFVQVKNIIQQQVLLDEQNSTKKLFISKANNTE
jgi:hypothetical protein